MIAATALTLGVPLVTGNVEDVENLDVLDVLLLTR